MNTLDIQNLKLIVDYGIIGLLLFIGFISIWFYFERLLFYKNIKPINYHSLKKLEIDLTNNVTIISSIASNSVYIGLLGTVFGIIITFFDMGQSGDIDVKIIISSLGLALKATALGLIVAIPSMVFYNHLVRKIEILLNLWQIENEDKEV
jgi:biopolymer transport protein ExbB